MKIVVVFNSKASSVERFNAVGHLCTGMPEIVCGNDLKFRRFEDADNNVVSVLTDYPLIILSARNQNHLREAHELAIAHKICSNAFFDCMKDADPVSQYKFVRSHKLSSQIYIAISLFGSDEQLKPITRKFSLFREPRIEDQS
jgi:hypothetical protein